MAPCRQHEVDHIIQHTAYSPRLWHDHDNDDEEEEEDIFVEK